MEICGARQYDLSRNDSLFHELQMRDIALPHAGESHQVALLLNLQLRFSCRTLRVVLVGAVCNLLGATF